MVALRRRLGVVLIMTALIVAGNATAASAATRCISTSGSKACFNDVSNKITASDLKEDFFEVYTEYCLSNSTSQSSCTSANTIRLYNKGDDVDTVSWYVNIGTNKRIVFRSCVSKPLWPDACSGWLNSPTSKG